MEETGGIFNGAQSKTCGREIANAIVPNCAPGEFRNLFPLNLDVEGSLYSNKAFYISVLKVW